MSHKNAGTNDLVRFLCVAAPKVAGGGLQVLFNLILIRHLTPDQFGMVSVCVLGIVACDAVLGSALDMAVLRLAPLHERSGDRLRSLRLQNIALILKPAGVGLLSVPVLLAGDAVSRSLFQRSGGAPLLLLSLAGLLGLLTLRSLQVHYQISNRFLAYGLTDAVQNLIKFGGISVLLALAVREPQWIVLVYAAGPLCVAAAGLALNRELARTVFDRAAWVQLGNVLRWYLPTAAMGSLTSRMDVFMVSVFSTVAQAGIFSAALAVAIAPQLIGTYLAVVYSPRIMPLWEEGRLARIYRRFQLRLLPICIVTYLFFALGVRFFGTLVAPGSFSPATGVMLMLFPAMLCSLLNFPWTISILLFLRPRFLMVFELVSFVMAIPLYAYSAAAWGAQGGAAVTVMYAGVKTLLFQVIAWKAVRSPVEEGRRAPAPLVTEGIEI